MYVLNIARFLRPPTGRSVNQLVCRETKSINITLFLVNVMAHFWQEKRASVFVLCCRNFFSGISTIRNFRFNFRLSCEQSIVLDTPKWRPFFINYSNYYASKIETLPELRMLDTPTKGMVFGVKCNVHPYPGSYVYFEHGTAENSSYLKVPQSVLLSTTAN